MKILDGLTGWLAGPFEKIGAFFLGIFDFFKVYVVGLITAVATLLLAFASILPNLLTGLVDAVGMLGSATNAWQPVDVSGWWSGGPSYALGAINALVPLQEIISAFVILVSVMIAGYSFVVLKALRAAFLWAKQMVAGWL